MGRISLFYVQRGAAQMAEIGYRIAQKHNGKGYATAAVGGVLDDAFNVYKLHRVEAATSPIKTWLHSLSSLKTALGSEGGRAAATV